MFFPFSLLFSNNQDCACADRLIDYLENEKYELVHRDLTKEQLIDTNQLIKEAYKSIDENPFFSDPTKIIKKQGIVRNAFYKKVLKKQND